MPKVSDVFAFLNQLAPVEYAMSYDNVGLLVGDGDAHVSRILVALDITDAVICEAVKIGAELIVSHHPVIFEPMKRIVAGDITANHVIALLQNRISAICMHTNLDAARGGVNDMLAQKLGVSCDTVIEPVSENAGIGWIGTLEHPMDFSAFLAHTAHALETGGLRYLKYCERVHRVAVGGGSCGSMLDTVCAHGCDTFVTADVKHSQWLAAAERGINLIDAGHFSTENVVTAPLVEKLSAAFKKIAVTCAVSCTEPIEYFKLEEAHYGA